MYMDFIYVLSHNHCISRVGTRFIITASDMHDTKGVFADNSSSVGVNKAYSYILYSLANRSYDTNMRTTRSSKLIATKG